MDRSLINSDIGRTRPVHGTESLKGQRRAPNVTTATLTALASLVHAGPSTPTTRGESVAFGTFCDNNGGAAREVRLPLPNGRHNLRGKVRQVIVVRILPGGPRRVGRPARRVVPSPRPTAHDVSIRIRLSRGRGADMTAFNTLAITIIVLYFVLLALLFYQMVRIFIYRHNLMVRRAHRGVVVAGVVACEDLTHPAPTLTIRAYMLRLFSYVLRGRCFELPTGSRRTKHNAKSSC